MVDTSLQNAIGEIVTAKEKLIKTQNCFVGVGTIILSNYYFALEIRKFEILSNLRNEYGVLNRLNKKGLALKDAIENQCKDFNKFSSDDAINLQYEKICIKYINEGSASLSHLEILQDNENFMVGGSIECCSQEVYDFCIKDTKLCGVN